MGDQTMEVAPDLRSWKVERGRDSDFALFERFCQKKWLQLYECESGSMGEANQIEVVKAAKRI